MISLQRLIYQRFQTMLENDYDVTMKFSYLFVGATNKLYILKVMYGIIYISLITVRQTR